MFKKLFSTEVNQKSNKRLIINMVANIVSYASSILVSFILTPYLINTLGKEAYSFYPIANTFVNYMSVIVNAMNAITNRFITLEIVNKNNKNINKYFSTSFFSNIILCLIFLIPMTFIIIFIDKILNVPINLMAAVRILFSLTFATMIVNVSTSTFGVATYATNRIDLRSMREMIAALLRVVLFILFFAFFKPTIIYVGVVALIVGVVNFLIQVFYTKNLLPDLRIRANMFTFDFMKKIIPSTIWNMINQLGNIMLSGTVMVLANAFYGATAGADYSIVHTIPGFMNGVITMLVGVFMPMVMQFYASGDIEGSIKQTIKAQNMVGILGCSALSVFVALGTDFFSLWVPNENAEYLQVISLISIIPHLIICSVWPVSNLNVIINKLKVPAIYLIVSGIVCITLSYIASFIFPNQLIALVTINTIIQVVWVGIFVPIYPCKYFNKSKKTFFPPLIKTLIATAIGIIISIWIKEFFVINGWDMLFLVAVICGIVVLTIQTIIVIGPKNVKHMIK